MLRRLGIPFTVQPSHIPEPVSPGPPEHVVAALALAKARAVAATAPRGALVLGADTEVVLEGRVFGKPANRADALGMLRALGGRVHEVITGLALVEAGGPREEALAVTSRVRMRDYADAEIEAYVATGEPFDKAGGYAVQGEGSRLVAEVIGCHSNVVGLPLETTRRLLAKWGLPPRELPQRPSEP